MKLYHASNLIITNPDIYHSRKKLDFGVGFYLTPLYKQAKIDKLEALKRLKYYKQNSQLCIRNQDILDNYLHFIESEEIK